ncbi:type II toxin-antitoxin system RelB/DinJ family antitoxin [uncultured Cardiobacterium sp.]|uniref:type II toxin-antitoxin system RelB/DinJ family antitoxin n=1 Tax=uncultured Cardiobacterium sp. TaxID=417619 RepID=UPI00262767B6|nr:type II toxin-antitoxin system RelB/DinJ family antitoxin [uncultured Cardiobacterium sp.]
MTTSNFNMRMDTETREQLRRVLAQYGLTIPQAFKLFANQTIKTGVLPLSFDWAANYRPNSETEKASRSEIPPSGTAVWKK